MLLDKRACERVLPPVMRRWGNEREVVFKAVTDPGVHNGAGRPVVSYPLGQRLFGPAIRICGVGGKLNERTVDFDTHSNLIGRRRSARLDCRWPG